MNVTRIVATLAAVGFVAGSAMAQTKAAAAAPATDGAFLSQGTVLFGGSFGWNIANDNSECHGKMKHTSISLAPEINYFIIDNLSVGLIGSVNWERERGWGSVQSQTTDLIGELVGRYYMPLCNNRIIPYVGATLGGGYSMYSSGDDSRHSDATLATYGGQGGFLVPLTESVMLDTCVSYKRYNRQGSPEVYHNIPRDTATTMISMGFKVKL
ncbi:MAG: hypothetical protein ACOYOU_04965 [Kiritimatiellia bacterium]